MMLSTYHCHTTYCDGKNTPREMIEAAIAAGCKEIGFSGHAYMTMNDSFWMSREGTLDYFSELTELKRIYENKIRIYIGIEQDYFSEPISLPYDYVIGSVHYIEKNGEFLAVDRDLETTRANIENHYAGDADAYAEDYFSLVADIYEKTHCNIVGHFDLITKFEEKESLLCESSTRYTNAAMRALSQLIKAPTFFEINTGAISRGHRTTPYPSRSICDILHKTGKPFVINSDAHSAANVIFGIAEAEAMCLQYGYPYIRSLSEIL